KERARVCRRHSAPLRLAQSHFASPLRFLPRRLQTTTSLPVCHHQPTPALGMDRTALMLSQLDLSGIGLEIGPSFSPLVPKSSGRRIETLDHASAAELRERYRNAANVDITRIEEVDYVSDGRPLAEIVNRQGYYDYIIASHVIAHTPDMLGFLKDCEALLKQDGVLVLAVPDKRRCFDVFQSLSSTGMLLQAHVERRTRATPGLMFDSIAYDGLRHGRSGWNFDDDQPLTFAHDLDFARYGFERAVASDTYVDAHLWRFTPSSFRLIVKDLYEIGHLGLREQFFSETDIFEFFISLSRRGPGCPFDRLTLARMTVAEQQEIPIGLSAVDPLDQGGPTAGEKVGLASCGPASAAAAPRAVISGDASRPELRIQVSHGDQKWEIAPAEFEIFPFEGEDQLRVIPT